MTKNPYGFEVEYKYYMIYITAYTMFYLSNYQEIWSLS